MSTSIEWTDATWNPTRGCSLVSPGCTNCYAMKFAHRFSGEFQPYEGLTKMRTKGGPVWTGAVRSAPEHILGSPFRWVAPRRVFVDSMSDLFHDAVPVAHVAMVFGVMALCGHHTFQILTKRADRMREIVSRLTLDDCLEALTRSTTVGPTHKFGQAVRRSMIAQGRDPDNTTWPLPHVWLGVSVEDQERAAERIPSLLETAASIRFISAEPLLGPIDLEDLVRHEGAGEHHFNALECDVDPEDDGAWRGRTIDWVIVGGESGPGAREIDLGWARSIRDQCARAEVAFFFKQAGPVARDGSWRRLFRDNKGGDPAEWPEDLRVRQFPEARS